MKCLVLLLCLGRLSHSQDSSTVNNDYYPELTADVISETYDISDPYDIPILSDNVVRTEPFQQQEVLPLLSTNVIDSNDVRENVRVLAATLIGNMRGVSQVFLEQTLDKKLMSNMRMKRNAHERMAGMV